MNESLLLQETGGGYFTLEDGTGRILLEVSVPSQPAGSASGSPMLDEQMARLEAMLRRDDEELALVASLL